MEFTIAKPKDTHSTGRVGTLYISADRLLKRFGMPHSQIPDTKESEWKEQSPDGKVRFEWKFKTIQGKTVITIYDYKDKTPFREIVEWHVGGKGDFEKIQHFFKTYLPNGIFEFDR